MDASHHGDDSTMDMPAHRAMFSGFLKTTEWFVLFLAMLLALIVLAFAVGLGWWTGLIAWVVVGIIGGLLLGLGGAFWATFAVSTVLLAVGGAITMGLQALT